MKLFIFIHSLSAGGAERVTVNLANYWSKKGWEVTIITMMSRERDFYKLHPGVHRIALQVDADSTNAPAAIRHNLRRVRALHTVLRQGKPEVALGMMSTANCLLSMAAIGTGVPAVGSERIYPPKAPIGRVWSWLRRRLYPRLAAVVAQTEESAQWLQVQVVGCRVCVISNPAIYPLISHEPQVTPGQVLGTADDMHMLLAAGRLGLQKGFDRLLVAFAELAPRFPDWCLVIIGEGEERCELEKQISDVGIKKHVFLPGIVGNIGEWYEAADLYVMTSRFEGFPNALAEALVYGLPAVSVDCKTGPHDILRHEIDGLLIPQNSHEALVEALATLMSDETLRQQYAARAVDARKRFALERIAGMWEELFEEVVNGRT